MTTDTPDITFVACIEAGPLEVGVLRLVESLRRWGGRFAGCPVIAATARSGPGLSRSTLVQFERLGVRHLRASTKHRYGWFKFLHKPLGLLLAESEAKTSQMCFLDSDILVLQEPNLLYLGKTEDLAACVRDKEQGTSGPDDPFDDLWRAMCSVVSLPLDELPWEVTAREGKRIRLYYNGGVFSYRRSSGFAQKYMTCCEQMLDARMSFQRPGFGIGIFEQAAIGLSACKHGLRQRHLPGSHNYWMGSKITSWYTEEGLREAAILHYHDSMWPWFWNELLTRMNVCHPSVAKWLAAEGPMCNPSSFMAKACRRLLSIYHERRQRGYLSQCKELRPASSHTAERELTGAVNASG